MVKLVTTTQLLAELIAWEYTETGEPSEEFLALVGTSAAGLAAPTSVTATDTSSTKITVTWAAVTGASSYTLYRGTTSDTSTMTVREEGLTTTSYEDLVSDPDGPDLDVQYWYALKAKSSTQISAFSSADAGKSPTGGATDSTVYEDAGLVAITVPSGKTSMEVKLWGAGGAGGVIEGWAPLGGSFGVGGGGASGSFYHLTGVTVSDTETYYLKVGQKSASSDGRTYLYRDSAGSSEHAYASAGGNGENADGSTTAQAGAVAAAKGANNFGSGSVSGDSADGVQGDDGGTFGGTGEGGAAVSNSGYAFGAGGDGSTTTTRDWGSHGGAIIIFT
jgi:hypothetical protein